MESVTLPDGAAYLAGDSAFFFTNCVRDRSHNLLTHLALEAGAPIFFSRKMKMYAAFTMHTKMHA
jgi:hypothetical protein